MIVFRIIQLSFIIQYIVDDIQTPDKIIIHFRFFLKTNKLPIHICQYNQHCFKDIIHYPHTLNQLSYIYQLSYMNHVILFLFYIPEYPS